MFRAGVRGVEKCRVFSFIVDDFMVNKNDDHQGVLMIWHKGMLKLELKLANWPASLQGRQ